MNMEQLLALYNQAKEDNDEFTIQAVNDEVKSREDAGLYLPNANQQTYWKDVVGLPEMTNDELKERFEEAQQDGDDLTARETMKEFKSRSFDNWMVESPNVNIRTSEFDGEVRWVDGFDAFDQWANSQDPLWSQINKKCRWCEPEVKFKLMARALLLRHMEIVNNQINR